MTKINAKYGYLFFIFFIYSLAVLSGKIASTYEILSLPFILFYGGQIIILLVYAVLWQFALKNNKLSIAYMLKSVTIVYGVLFGYIFFQESIELNQIIAIILIFIGVYLVADND